MNNVPVIWLLLYYDLLLLLFVKWTLSKPSSNISLTERKWLIIIIFFFFTRENWVYSRQSVDINKRIFLSLSIMQQHWWRTNMYSFHGLPNEVSWKTMGIPGDRGSLTSTPRNGYSKGLGGLKQRSPPWRNGYFLDPLHITELPITSPWSHKLSPVDRRRWEMDTVGY